MRSFGRRFVQGLMLAFCLGCVPAWAAEWTAFVPELRYATVDGNESKFQAHHWMNGGWDAGFREFSLETEDANGAEIRVESRLLPGNHDYWADIEVEKEDEWHWGASFKNFRKYYSSLGGIHAANSDLPSLRVVDSGRDLFVDVGKFELEAGIKREWLPYIDLVYEYEYKTGTKSRLTWATVTANGVGRKVGPSWQEIDEQVHAFELDFHDSFKGFQWSSKQRWEHFENDTMREEKNLSNDTTASNKMVRQHFLDPKADQFSSTWDLKKWFFKDKVLASTAYRYSQIENSEVETILEMNEGYEIYNFSTSSHQVLPSDSTNQYRSHSGVFSLYWQLSDFWTVGAKGKLEDIRRNGQSTLNADTVASASSPDRVADRYDVSNTQSDIKRAGEGLTLRYYGFKNLTLYNDLEFEQVNNDLNEDRQSRSAGEVFTRVTVNRSYRGVEEAGFNYHPFEGFLWAGQYRLRKDNIDYDDIMESAATTTARSAFFDGQKGEMHQVSTRVRTKLCSWLEPTVRYQYNNYGLTSRFEDRDLDLRANTYSNTTTVDLPLNITKEFYVTASYQYVDMMSVTPANEDTPQNYAPFHGDTQTWMLGADYLISNDLTLNTSVQYQTADNVMDINSEGVPFGADYNKTDLTVGLKYKMSKTMTLEPRYDFYQYRPNENVEFGKYDAHVFWLGLAIDWA